MNKQRIKEIRERCDKATGGPWENSYFQSGTVCVLLPKGRAIHIYGASPGDLPEGEYQQQRLSDGEFCATARKDLPDALNYIEALQARVKELEQILWSKG